jgi:hypothetical protein
MRLPLRLTCAGLLAVLACAPPAVADHVQAGPPGGASGLFPPDPPNPAPSISGVPVVGATLTANQGGWTGAVVSHRWVRCDAVGADCGFVHNADNDPTLTLGPGDVGHTFKLRVTGSSGLGGSREVDSGSTGTVAALAPAAVSAPVITGVARNGQRLTMTQDATFEGTAPITTTREWLRCDAGGAACIGTGDFDTTYDIVAADVGARLKLRVRGTGPDGQSAETESALTDVVAAGTAEASKPVPLRPFPRVVIAGKAYPLGAAVSRLAVRGPNGARVRVRCRGEGCPVSRISRRIRGGGIRLRALETNLLFGTVIEIRVTRPGTIGKFTRIRIRRGRPPARKDLCASPGARKPVPCPKSLR